MILFSLLLGVLLQAVPPTASIQGVVQRAGTSPPETLMNARVELVHSSGTAITRTDSAGRFLFSGLPAGTFRLRVTKDGYLRQEYRQIGLDKPGPATILTAAQQMQNIVLRLESAPTIVGVIRNENEAKISGVVVQALKRGYDSRGNPSLKLIASTITDDRGTYRLFWLDPGEYLISATHPPPLPGTEAGVTAWAPTYFPGYTDIDSAKPIRVESGREAIGIDFKVLRLPTMNVNGFVSTRLLGAVATDVLVVPPEDGGGVAKYSGKSTVRDGYSISGVAPGSYIVSARMGRETGSVRARVTNSPNPRIRGLRVDLRLSEGLAVSGRVITGGPTDLRSARIHLSEMDPALPEPALASIAASNQFVVPAVQPGNYTVKIDGLTNDLYLKNATFGATDVLEQPMPVAFDNPSPPELQIQIGLDGGRIAGAVYDRNNALFPNAEVILVPTSVSRLRFDRYRTAITGDDGQFIIRGIAPGDYKLFAWEHLEPNAHLNVEYMRPYEDSGTPVRIEPSQSGTVSLRLISAQ